MTQQQIIWNMKFSNLLNEVLDYQKSAQYYDNAIEAISANTRSQERIDERIRLRNKKAEIYAKLNKLTGEFEEWVKEHPYPIN